MHVHVIEASLPVVTSCDAAVVGSMMGTMEGVAGWEGMVTDGCWGVRMAGLVT